MNVFKGHQDHVLVVLTSYDDKYGFSGSEDKNIRIWDLYTHETLKVFNSGHSTGVTHMDTNKTGELLVTGSYNTTIIIWNLKIESIETIIKNNQEDLLTNLQFFSNEKCIIYSSYDNIIHVYSMKKHKNQAVFMNLSEKISASFVIDDKSCGIIGTDTGKVYIWDLKQKTYQKFCPHTSKITALTVCMNFSLLITACCDGFLKV